jgi:hypothetical protein
MNFKGCEKKWQGLSLKYCPSISLQGLKKTLNKISQDSQPSKPRFKPDTSHISKQDN